MYSYYALCIPSYCVYIQRAMAMVGKKLITVQRHQGSTMICSVHFTGTSGYCRMVGGFKNTQKKWPFLCLEESIMLHFLLFFTRILLSDCVLLSLLIREVTMRISPACKVDYTVSRLHIE